MKNEEIYQEWKKHRKQLAHPIHMSSRVMDRIHEYERAAGNTRSSDYLKEIPFFANRMMKYAAAIGLSALGVYRVFSVTGSLIFP
jgi:hypothetical protein